MTADHAEPALTPAHTHASSAPDEASGAMLWTIN
jgi:hypothetical protein